MDDTFKIFVHRLKAGQEEIIQEELSCAFLDIHEADLAFNSPVHVVGKATVADDVLVLTLRIETEAVIPCAICNQGVNIQILIPNFCHLERLDDIRGGIFDYQDALREGILLELPYTAECNGGDCPERAILAKYFTQQK